MANQHKLEIGAKVKPRYFSGNKAVYTVVGEIYWGYDVVEGCEDDPDLRIKPNRVLTLVDQDGVVSEAREDELTRA